MNLPEQEIVLSCNRHNKTSAKLLKDGVYVWDSYIQNGHWRGDPGIALEVAEMQVFCDWWQRVTGKAPVEQELIDALECAHKSFDDLAKRRIRELGKLRSLLQRLRDHAPSLQAEIDEALSAPQKFEEMLPSRERGTVKYRVTIEIDMLDTLEGEAFDELDAKLWAAATLELAFARMGGAQNHPYRPRVIGAEKVAP